MDPIVTASLISGTGSLLGGLFGRKSKPSYVVPNYQKIRDKAEAAGFNPLTALTSAPGAVVAGGQNYMGSAIADAALHLADGLSEKAAQEGEAQKLREENAELAKKVQDLTIRPRVGGIYSRNVTTPSIRSALGGSADDEAPDFDVRDHAPLADGAGLSDDELRSPVQIATAKDVPAFRMFGHDFYGSGMFSTGQQIEDSIGEGPASWIWPAMTIPDAFANEAAKLAHRRLSVGMGPKRSTNDLTFGDQGYPRDYARPPGTGKKASRQHLPYISYPMYPPSPFAGPR